MLLTLIQISPLVKHIRRIQRNRQRHDSGKPSSGSNFIFLRLPNIPDSLWTLGSSPGWMRWTLKGLRVDNYAGLLVRHFVFILIIFFSLSVSLYDSIGLGMVC
ncbi:hypothetical protein BDV27DRAFT_125705 [Aspergillus caelatus]|uniref:Uncharacterized protein n=1 Tax=Aspergillus caelatus TaxID=61420 RepID=A0A5N7A8L8_9EURO|nr:uncharacterized protein BDV27DRAFT_125705 [Aspergillus caelatus]KAE8366217.1 hypothetical protein BDV27DRAFT_125705 [Aspergillus caelatus]